MFYASAMSRTLTNYNVFTPGAKIWAIRYILFFCWVSISILINENIEQKCYRYTCRLTTWTFFSEVPSQKNLIMKNIKPLYWTNISRWSSLAYILLNRRTTKKQLKFGNLRILTTANQQILCRNDDDLLLAMMFCKKKYNKSTTKNNIGREKIIFMLETLIYWQQKKNTQKTK